MLRVEPKATASPVSPGQAEGGRYNGQTRRETEAAKTCPDSRREHGYRTTKAVFPEPLLRKLL